jgi:hypothetical protein
MARLRLPFWLRPFIGLTSEKSGTSLRLWPTLILRVLVGALGFIGGAVRFVLDAYRSRALCLVAGTVVALHILAWRATGDASHLLRLGAALLIPIPLELVARLLDRHDKRRPTEIVIQVDKSVSEAEFQALLERVEHAARLPQAVAHP